jgi:hypothetical protein
MTILDDFNFEILPTSDADSGVLFGIGQDVSLDDAGFVPGSTDWAVQDTESSQTGVTNFGRDRLLGPTWAWQLHVNRQSVVEARDTLGSFRAAWHALHLRDTPGAVLPIRYQLEGQPARRIYGRPRRFEAPPDNRILGGYVPISCDFKCVDAFTYDDVMQNVSLAVGADYEDPDVDTGGGFIFPIILPYVSLPPKVSQQQLEIGGDAPAYPIVRFTGPVVNPALVTDDWTLSLNLTIPDGQYVEIDTRPWRQTALLNGTASVAGSLGRRTRMSKIFFRPQERFEARYLGASVGSSTCDVKWASTWNGF